MRPLPLSILALAAALLCGTVLRAQSSGMGVWNSGGWEYGYHPSLEGMCEEGNGWDVKPCPSPDAPAPPPATKTQPLLSTEPVQTIETRVVAEIQQEVDKRTDADDALAAPGMWAYYLGGKTVTDAGGTVALERWPCRLFKGRACFAGLVAGKKTAGIAVGAGLRRMGAKGWNAVAWLGFVVPYEAEGVADSIAAAPALGVSLKF